MSTSYSDIYFFQSLIETSYLILTFLRKSFNNNVVIRYCRGTVLGAICLKGGSRYLLDKLLSSRWNM